MFCSNCGNELVCANCDEHQPDRTVFRMSPYPTNVAFDSLPWGRHPCIHGKLAGEHCAKPFTCVHGHVDSHWPCPGGTALHPQYPWPMV